MGSSPKIVNVYHALKDEPYPQDGQEESESKADWEHLTQEIIK